MDRAQLQAYLHSQIPLSAAMQVSVEAVAIDRIVLSAPLEPNINHKRTLFGGSASAVAILSAWSLVHWRLLDEGLASEIVIQSNEMAYDRPITGRFSAASSLPERADWPAFVKILARKGRARIAVDSVLVHDDVVAGRLTGKFVAFLRDR